MEDRGTVIRYRMVKKESKKNKGQGLCCIHNFSGKGREAPQIVEPWLARE